MKNYKKLAVSKKVLFGDDSIGWGIGYGDIDVLSKVDNENVYKLTLKNVLHVPCIRRKLLSITTATDSNTCCQMYEDRSVLISNNGKGEIILKAERYGNLFKANLEECACESNIADQSTRNKDINQGLKLWHERLGHVSKRTIIEMNKSQCVEGLHLSNITTLCKASNSFDEIDCEPCVSGKLSRKTFPMSSRERAKNIGERLHADIDGPVGAKSIGESEYCLILKDEYSTFRSVYFMKSRDKAYECVRDCVAKIHGDTGRSVRNFVSDRGSEFTSKRTQEYSKSMKITHIVSAPHMPEQNGMIERDNRTAMNLVRSMLCNKYLNDKLWGEALNCAIYILNRVPNRHTSGRTPFELYINK